MVNGPRIVITNIICIVIDIIIYIILILSNKRWKMFAIWKGTGVIKQTNNFNSSSWNKNKNKIYIIYVIRKNAKVCIPILYI